MESAPDPVPYGYVLLFLLILFFLRVIGQFIVVLYHPRWLPPMAQWYSGLIPYRILLSLQILLLILLASIISDFLRSAGFFVEPKPGVGRAAVWFSYLYFGSMVVRYVIRMLRRPHQRWFGGTIPIFIHMALAVFLFVFGHYHAR